MILSPEEFDKQVKTKKQTSEIKGGLSPKQFEGQTGPKKILSPEEFDKIVDTPSQTPTMPAMSAIPQAPPSPDLGSLLKKGAMWTGEQFVGAGETALSLASGLLAWPMAEIAGAAKLATSGAEEARKTKEQLSSYFTYRPKTKAGRGAIQPIGKGFEALMWPAKKVGETVEQITGSKELGYAAQFGAELATFKGLHIGKTKIKAKLRKPMPGEPGYSTPKGRAEAARKVKLVEKLQKAKPERPLAKLIKEEKLVPLKAKQRAANRQKMATAAYKLTKTKALTAEGVSLEKIQQAMGMHKRRFGRGETKDFVLAGEASRYSPKLAMRLKQLKTKALPPSGQFVLKPKTKIRPPTDYPRGAKFIAGKQTKAIVEYKPLLAKKGTPYRSAQAAHSAIRKRGLDPKQYKVVEVKNGWGIKRKTQKVKFEEFLSDKYEKKIYKERLKTQGIEVAVNSTMNHRFRNAETKIALFLRHKEYNKAQRIYNDVIADVERLKTAAGNTIVDKAAKRAKVEFENSLAVQRLSKLSKGTKAILLKKPIVPEFKSTEEAIAFGLKATPEQKAELKRLREASIKKAETLIRKDLHAGFAENLKGQLYREALQAKEIVARHKKGAPTPKQEAQASVTLDSLGMQSMYEKIKETIKKRKPKEKPLSRIEANKLKRDIHITAKNIWGDKTKAQYEQFKQQMFGRKVSARDLSPNELRALSEGLNELFKRAGAKVGGSKTKIVKHRIVKHGKRKTVKVKDLEVGYTITRPGGASWEVIEKTKTGVKLQNEKGKIRTVPLNRTLKTAEKATRDLRAPKITEYESNAIRSVPELETRPLGGWTENTIRVVEELGKPIKKIFYDNIVNAEVLAKREHIKLMDGLKPLKKGLGIKAQNRIGAYAIAQQRHGPEILKAMKVKVPKLTAKELKAYKYMRKELENLYTRLNRARIESGKEPFRKVDNYFTFFRVFSLQEKLGWDAYSPGAAKQFQTAYDKVVPIHRKTTPFKFEKQREWSKREVRLDAFNIFDNYANSALRHIHKSPHIAKGRELLLRFKDGFELKEVKPNTARFLTQLLDAAAEQRIQQLPRAIEKGLAKLNTNLTYAVLSANIRSALIQPSAVVNTVAEIGPKYTFEGIQGILQPKVRKAIMEKSALITRQYDVAVKEALSGIKGKYAAVKTTVGRAALKPLSILDMQTAMATWWGAYKKALKFDKMSEKQAITYANDVVTKTQASALEIDLAPIQRTALGRTLSLFQTFVINNWNFLAKDVMGIKNPRISKAQAIKKSAAWIMAATLTNIFYEDVLGINSPLPTPIRAFMEGQERGESDVETAMRVAKEIAELVPIIGGGLRYGSHPFGPIAQLGTDITEKVGGRPGPKKTWFNIGGRILGIPGTAQIGKTQRRLKRGQSLPGALLGTKKQKSPMIKLRKMKTLLNP